MRRPRITSPLRALLFCVTLSAAGHAAAQPRTITVGQLTLTLCNREYTGYCGSITRPIDPQGLTPGDLTVGFEYYPRSDVAQPRLGTILPQEGGPGYSSTGTRDYYLAIFDALRDRRDVLIVDKRGTGLSSPIDCPALQTGSLALSAVAACARQLGDTAWFYGTDFAAQDIVAVLDALDIPDVDFYGDSYGTFVGQVLAGLYPWTPAQHHSGQRVSGAPAGSLVRHRLGGRLVGHRHQLRSLAELQLARRRGDRTHARDHRYRA